MTHARLFDTVVTHTPESWQFTGIPWKSTSHYSIYDVDLNSDEFQYVIADINNRNIDKVDITYSWAKRIQNVCMFGRYLFRHQQLFAIDANSVEEIRYTCIPEDSIEQLARHNVDSRYLQIGSDDCKFISLSRSPFDVINAVQKHNISVPWVLVCVRVSTDPSGNISSDAETYPDYVLKIKSINGLPKDRNFFKDL